MAKPDVIKEREIKAWRGQGKIENIPIPSRKILEYAISCELLERPGLALHIATTEIIADVLASAIVQANAHKSRDQQMKIDKNRIREILVAYHAPRSIAEDGKKKTSTSVMINTFMETHDDIQLATLMARDNNLPLSVVSGIEELQRDLGFPRRTIGPENRYRKGAIDWDMVISQLATWCAAGGIVDLDEGFNQRIKDHSDGKTSKSLSLEELLAYKEWALERLTDFCAHVGIQPQDFFVWLRENITGSTDEATINTYSAEIATTVFNRPLKENEFFPTSQVWLYLAKRLNSKSMQSPAVRARMEERLAHPRRILNLLARRGITFRE